MQIRHLIIKNFRGIKQLEWKLDGNIICLIGPGDSTKTTILDAIEYVLSPRFLNIYDTDFYDCDFENPIEIMATIGQLPAKITNFDAYGYNLRGWTPEGQIKDEHQDGDEHVLTVKLSVDKSLEPQWAVMNDRLPEGLPIRSAYREALGICRISDDVDFELGWARGSTLGHSIHTRSAIPVFAEVSRKARSAFSDNTVDELVVSAKSATDAAKEFGVVPVSAEYAPGLDAAAVSSRTGAITLYDGCVPVRQFGLGTRRLIATAVQRSAADGQAVLLIDEIEHGLEPYRLRHLLRMLRNEMSRGGFGQVILTSHSPTVLVELPCNHLRIVHKIEANTIIQPIEPELQALVRTCPESLLSKKVIVCEGKTEYGLLRGIESVWAEKHDDLRLAHLGVALQDGNGHEAPKRAEHLRNLGYEVALFADSDEETSKSNDVNLAASGIKVIRWSGQVSTEQRICADVPLEILQELVSMVLDTEDEPVVFDKIATELKCLRNTMTADISSWHTNGITDANIREAFGFVAKRQKNGNWFKRVDLGERLGGIIGRCLTQVASSDLASKLKELEQWAYGS